MLAPDLLWVHSRILNYLVISFLDLFSQRSSCEDGIWSFWCKARQIMGLLVDHSSEDMIRGVTSLLPSLWFPSPQPCAGSCSSSFSEYREWWPDMPTLLKIKEFVDNKSKRPMWTKGMLGLLRLGMSTETTLIQLFQGSKHIENGILGCHHCIPSELLLRWPSKDIGAPGPCDVKFGKYPPKH